MEPIFVFGASGHAKVVVSVTEEQALYRIAIIADDNPKLGGAEFYGYRVTGGRTELLERAAILDVRRGLVAIGNNAHRLDVARWLRENGLELVTAVHPSAQIARGACLDQGTVVMAGTVINSDAMIGRSVIINTASTIDHDCVIEEGAHIAPGCHLCGNVKLGRAGFLGAGSIVAPGVTIGSNAVVGAGSVVIRAVPDDATVAGNPCGPVGSNKARS